MFIIINAAICALNVYLAAASDNKDTGAIGWSAAAFAALMTLRAISRDR